MKHVKTAGISLKLSTLFKEESDRLGISMDGIEIVDGGFYYTDLKDENEMNPQRWLLERTMFNKAYDNCFFTYCGHNSAKFDNYFIMQELLKMDLMGKNSFKLMGNQILSMKFHGADVLDSFKLLTCSLAAACTSFKTKFKKLDMDHNDV